MKRGIVVVALALALPLAAFADHKIMHPGQWEVTVTMQMVGMPYQIPPQTVSKCVKPEDVKDPKEIILSNNKDKRCQITNVKETGNKVSWSMACKGERGSGSGTGEMTFSAETYEGHIQMTAIDPRGQPHQMSSHIQAHRVGDCK